MGTKYNFAIFALIALVAILYTYFFHLKQPDRLPIYQPYQINPALVDHTLLHEKDHRILDFTLINQLGDTVSLFDLSGQTLIVDFYFFAQPNMLPKRLIQLLLPKKDKKKSCSFP